MDWVNKNYEKIIIGLASMIVIVVSSLFILKALKFKQQFIIKKFIPTYNFPKTNQANVDIASTLLVSPEYINEKIVDNSKVYLNIGPLMVDKDGTRIFMGGKQMLHAPIPNEWFFVNDLNILDKDIKNKDSDYDGFTNIEEFKYNTKPRDSSNFPELKNKLYFSDLEKQDYILQFTAYNQPDIGINRTSPKPVKSRLDLNINSRFFNDKRFVILDYTEKFGKHKELGFQINISELKILDTYQNKEHILIFNQKKNIPTYTAVLTFSLKNETIYKKKLGETFYLPGAQDIVYTVEDISEENVKLSYSVIDPETKEPIGERENFLLEKNKNISDSSVKEIESEFIETEE